MWIVVREWDGQEAVVQEFDNEEEARGCFDSLAEETSAKMYLAKVEKTFN